MKKIITILVCNCLIFTVALSQNEIRLIDDGPTRVIIQIRLGPSAVLPETGADVCNPDEVNDNGMITSWAMPVIWTDASITNLVVVDEDDDLDFCTPLTNTIACVCNGIPNPPCDPPNANGPAYGVENTASSANSGKEWNGMDSLNYITFGNITNTCTPSGWWNAPENWVAGTFYNIVTLEAVTNPAPPGSEPLVLTEMLSIQPTGLGNILPPNINTSLNGVEQSPEGYDLAVGSPLPLDLLSFDAKKEGDKSAALVWTTANEVNTKLFVIQRSGDRESWNDIGGVEAAVNSSGIKQYNFMDKNVFSGRANREVYYYRLKMVDQDDSFKYSNIDVVSFSAFLNTQDGVNIFMYPNPATDGVNVEIAHSGDGEPITHLEMYDVTGKLVFSRDILADSEIEFINFADLGLASGTYVLRAVDAANVAQAHEKLIVMR